MVFHDFNSVEELHVETTNRCNAACPMCGRNINGGAERIDQFSEWGEHDAEKVFSEKFINLKNILFCGAFGDPAVAKHGLNHVEAAKRNTDATVEFYSNGSIRNKDWWSDLAKILSTRRDHEHYRKFDIGIFSVDGLADTNHLYRRKTNFEKIMENAEAFIAAGGKARWDYLVFKHNEHQVEEAEKLAKKMGFYQFRIRKTSRFAYSPDGPTRYPVEDVKGNFEYYLEPPTVEEFQREGRKSFYKKVKEEKTQLMKRTIKCLNKSTFERLYISAAKEVFPCCFIAGDTNAEGKHLLEDTRNKILNHYEPNFNSLASHSWQEILNHPWFKKELVESWNDPKKALVRCNRTCGHKVSPIISQSQDRFSKS